MELQYLKIGDLCNVSSSKRVFARQYVDEGIPFYRQKEIIDKKNGNTLEEPIYISESVYNEFKDKSGVPESGDLLITAVGATLGIPYVVGNEKFYFKDGNLMWLSDFKEELNSTFLYYWIDSTFGTQTLWNRTIGSAQPALTIDSLKKLSIPIPSRKIQDKIGSTLKTYDEMLENNNKRIRLLEQMAENLYKECFVRFRFLGYEDVEFDGTLPIGWQYQPISESMDFFDSQRVPLSSIQRDGMKKIYPYYGAAKLMDYVDDYLFDGEYLLLGEDGTVVTTDGFPILQLVNDKFWVNNHAHVIRGKGNISTRFLYLTFLRFPITGAVTGSAQPKISKGRLEKLKILVPDAITMEYFNNLINPMFDEINILKKQVIRITKQRDMLLPRLMSGKLEV